MTNTASSTTPSVSSPIPTVLPLFGSSQRNDSSALRNEKNNELDTSRGHGRWRKSQRPPSYRRGMTVACEEDVYEADFVQSVRLSVGLYQEYPLATSLLEGQGAREAILRKNCKKQMNHYKGATGGWIKSMFVLEVSLSCCCRHGIVFRCIHLE